ncbi:hybrid sensor histidine kinase/response regulator [Nodularia spumigena]|uniref:hybrid sensor histidine kinase/response regulator n=3 Tax=Nodularia spumigena TaxID=70799 RepID=UPI002330D15C|nr:response regulator [Nodularia spumigena]MDB9339397.1 response regulator [Nodularia spumigena CS-589/07]MDB9343877.1 response regulator [Nodularia spumigena CS-588/06]MDB9500397.1 response regulator [Nodularia spumigena CS-336/02]
MLPEQQQRILGYFIEEARDHLNTIEQGLLNLQSTLNDPEMVNEVFRAAHSIKGSAAMLGLNSIQHTSHRLEDCFKVLKEHPVEVDQKLESLFLGVCDTLKVLLEHLSGPFGLSEEAANTLMSETEPVFVWLYEHLELLVQQNSSGEVKKNTTQAEQNWQDSVTTLTDLFLRDDIPNLEADTESTSTESPLFVESPEADSLLPPPVGEYGDEFQTQVLPVLREMLQLFKKQITPESRNNLQQCCQQLVRLGQRWNLHHWCRLCQAAANAIANPENTYLTLAKIVITDIKQAQELVLQGRETEIVSSQRLAALLNLPEPESSEAEDLFAHQPASVVEPTANEELSSTTNNFASEPNILQPTDSITSLTELSDQLQQIQDTSAATENTVPETASNQMLFLNYQEETDISNIGQHGPLVGLSELNTLADLFEGDTPELDETCQQEENLEISAANKLGINFSDSNIEDVDSDLADFLSLDEGKSDDDLDSSLTTTEELNLLFGNNLAEAEQLNQQNKSTSVALSSESQEYSGNTNLNELSGDLLASTPDENKLLPTSEITQAEQISTNQQSSVDDLFVETNNADNADTEEILLDDDLEAQPTIVQPESLTLDALFDDFDNIADSPQLSDDDSEISDLFEITPPPAIELTQVEDNLNDFWNQESATEQDEVVSVLEQDVAKALEESLFAAAASSDIFGKIADFSPSSSTSMELEDDDLNLDEPDLELPSDTGESDDLFAELAASHSFSSSDDDEQDLSLEEISGFDQEPEAITDSLTSMELEDDDLNLDEPDLELPSDTGESDDLFADLAASHSLSSNDDDEQDLTLTDSSTSMELEDDDLNLDEPDLELPSDTGESDDLFAELAASHSFSSNDEDEQDLSLEEISGFDQEPEALDLTPEFTKEPLQIDAVDSPPVFADLEVDLFDSLDENPQILGSEISETDNSTYVQLDNADDYSADESNLEFGEDILEKIANLSDDLFNTDPISENANVVLPEEEVTSVSSAAEATLENDPTGIQDEFAELEALLEEEAAESSDASIPEEDFADLEALLNTSDDDQEGTVFNDKLSYAPQFELTTNQAPRNSIELSDADDEFSDLEKLLAEADQSISHSSPNKTKLQTSKIARSSDRRTARFEETMKVPVKQLDDMSNLVGELVVNRNTLEQDHERLRQSLDNLLIQVQHLSDVGARMQELYERSLLEASLLASRKTKERKETKEKNLHTNDSHSNMGFSELEMDRFTPFHTLSQEMIEFIVRVRESASDIDFVTEETERVARQFRQVTTQLQEGLTRARMVPFSQTIDRLRRGVRDNAIKYGKQVDLVIEGGDTLIDKMILDHLTDPLTHMLNNAIAHGIETPEIRQQSGKQPVGVITIRAFYQGHQTVISVGDDGAGIDPERVKTKAVQIGMMTATQAKSISRMEVYDLLFQPGFTIKDKADEISGRGVGMDVVRSEISDIRGIVNTDSAIGKGTTFTIRLPVTLSICKALFCVSDKARIAFPMDGVEDTLDIPVNSIQHHADGQSYISWRDTLLPFQPLKELLTFNRQLSRGNVYGGNRDDGMVSVVVVRSGNTLIALQIDLVLSEQEIVIKQFESPVPKPIGVAGATVLGDGRIMPIADVLEIIEIFQGRISKHNGDKLWQQQEDIPNLPETTVEKIDPTVLIVDDSITVRELLSLTFNKAGYRVEQARDGQEAWDKLRSGLPCDIVFCDIEMPRCDGLELLSRIQKDSSLNHLPIAMLTSRGADKHRQMAIQLGASGYFTKPYLEEALLEAAVRMLKGEKLVNA